MKIFDDSSANEILIEEEGLKLKLVKKSKESAQPTYPNMTHIQSSMANLVSSEIQKSKQDEIKISEETAAAQLAIEANEKKLHEIKSPIVGTFYRSPSPDSPVFIEVGARVTPGTTLCIVEAMKLMNEIESDTSGVISKILVDNAQPVEFGQVLFLVETD